MIVFLIYSIQSNPSVVRFVLSEVNLNQRSKTKTKAKTKTKEQNPKEDKMTIILGSFFVVAKSTEGGEGGV